MNNCFRQIKLFTALPWKDTRRKRKSTLSSYFFLKGCLDLIHLYEMIEQKYNLLLDAQHVSTIPDAAYKEQFSQVLQMNEEMVKSFGRNIDNFINRTTNIRNIAVTNKIQFEPIIDMYLVAQRKYALMYKLYEWLVQTQPDPGPEAEGFPTDTLPVNMPAAPVTQYTGKHQ